MFLYSTIALSEVNLATIAILHLIIKEMPMNLTEVSESHEKLHRNSSQNSLLRCIITIGTCMYIIPPIIIVESTPRIPTNNEERFTTMS